MCRADLTSARFGILMASCVLYFFSLASLNLLIREFALLLIISFSDGLFGLLLIGRTDSAYGVVLKSRRLLATLALLQLLTDLNCCGNFCAVSNYPSPYALGKIALLSYCGCPVGIAEPLLCSM